MTAKKKNSKNSSRNKGQAKKSQRHPGSTPGAQEAWSGPPLEEAKPATGPAKRPVIAVAVAFLSGLALATTFFLFVQPRLDGIPMKTVVERPLEFSPAVTSDGSTRQGGQGRSNEQDGSLPKIPDGEILRLRAQKGLPLRSDRPAEDPRGSACGPGSLSSREKQEADDSGSEAIPGPLGKTRARIDRNALPYEESPDANLEDLVRQADYAIIQAAWLKKLPASSLRLAGVEERGTGAETYHFQWIDILPGKDAEPFLQALQECLAAWAETASLQETGGNQWSIAFQGVPTHLVRLYPGQDDFPALPEPGPPQTSADPSGAPFGGLPGETPVVIEPPRVRKPGEPARLCIVIDDLGASAAAIETLLGLDYPVSFAFWPHGAHTRKGAFAANAAGMEILVHQPMEPLGYPGVKPGPDVLLVGMSGDQIREILLRSVKAVPFASGLNNHMGSRFTQDTAGVEAVLSVLKEKELFVLDSLTHAGSVFMLQAKKMGLEHYKRDVFLDVTPSKNDILARLRQAERIALLTGSAVAIGHPKPETLAALKDWQKLRNRQVSIVRLRELGR